MSVFLNIYQLKVPFLYYDNLIFKMEQDNLLEIHSDKEDWENLENNWTKPPVLSYRTSHIKKFVLYQKKNFKNKKV